jgi:hypothetical protein
MTRIVVASKQKMSLLQDTQAGSVVLEQPSIIQIGIAKENISSMVRSGNSLQITLKNGEKIVLENFFTENGSPHSLAFPDKSGKFLVAEFDEAGKLIKYNPVDHLSQLGSSINSTGLTETQQTAVVTEGVDDGGIAWSSVLKTGLAVLGAEAVYLVAFDKDDDKDHTNADVTPPAMPGASLDADGKVITGTTEAGSTVYAKDPKGNILGQAVADSNGKYEIKLDKAITDGNKVSVTAKDQAGNESKANVLEGTKDTISPEKAQAQVSDSGSIVTGKAEAGAKIYVYGSDGKTVIGGPVTVASDGTFSVTVEPALKSGEKATVIVEDTANNRSEAAEVEVGKDTLPPDQPKVTVSDKGDLIKGIAEAGAKVKVMDAAGKVIGEATADNQGNFTVTLDPPLTDKAKGAVVVEDAAGNQSKPLEVIAGKDNIAPDAPEAVLNEEGTIITGKAEPGSKIEVRSSSDGTLLGYAEVKEDGTYTVTLSKALTDNTLAKVYASDKSGNQSSATEIKGTKDTIPPGKVEEVTAYDDTGSTKLNIGNDGKTKDSTPVFEGKGEAGATVYIYQDGKPVASVKVDENGKWTYTTDELAPGSYSYTFRQVDKSGLNGQESDPFKFTVESTVKTAALESHDSAVSSDQTADTVNDQSLAKLLSAPISVISQFNTVEDQNLQNQDAVKIQQLFKDSASGSDAGTIDLSTVLPEKEMAASQGQSAQTQTEPVTVSIRTDLNELMNQHIPLI